MEASAPLAGHIEPEPPTWQPRALWLSARLLCGVISFYFLSFLFAYFYLRSLDTNHSWKIGKVDPTIGFGIAILVCFVLSAVLFRAAATRPTDTFTAGLAAVVLALIAVILQFVQYLGLDFGASQGGYASVFTGWTATYAVFALGSIYWMETQVASFWRAKREGGIDRQVAEGVPADDVQLLRAGIEACSFFWAFYVAIGVAAFIVLYVV
jgi:heme/copper-type cytochrome/quinol oxidase subunit 4